MRHVSLAVTDSRCAPLTVCAVMSGEYCQRLLHVPSHAHSAEDHVCRPALLVVPPHDSWGLSSGSNSLVCCSQQDERQVSRRQELPAGLSGVAHVVRPLEDADELAETAWQGQLKGK